MPRSTASGPERWLAWALILCACGGGEPPPDAEVEDEAGCTLDADSEPDSAAAMASEGSDGFLCPVEDEDWYQLSVPSGHALVRVTLESATARTPVEPTYAVWSTAASGAPEQSVAIPEAEDVGSALDDTHCLGSGDYLLVVRDQGDDAQDVRNPYRVSVETAPEPDPHEPNGAADAATPMALGADVTGYVACSGDVDVYRFDAQAGAVIQLRMQSDEADYQPRVELLDPDAEVVANAEHLGASLRPTDLAFSYVAQRTGVHLLRVVDAGGDDADPEVPYTLRVTTIDEVDSNEPNDHPDQAVALSDSPVSCGTGFSGWIEATGTIGAAGDVDYFALPLAGCDGGILEAELNVSFAVNDQVRAWQLQREIQAALGVVRAHPGSPCSADDTCRVLSTACDPAVQPAYACEGFFNSCLSEGLCAGATLCLPGGQCGALQVQRHYTSVAVPELVLTSPPPNQARLAAPIPGDSLVYLQVSDFRSDAGDPAAIYTLRARVRAETDPGDSGAAPDNVYANDLRSDSVPLSESLPRARPVPVHDCTSGDCCGAGTWEQGSIGYENDLDVFTYAHPCPGEDCLMRVHYEVDDGPVEPGLFIHHGTRPFFTRELAAGTSGSFGGVGEGIDECFYAYFEHDEYSVLVRDRTEDGPDWSSDQRFRFCVEKVSNTCEAPCKDYGDTGCGQP